jgi:hypothetical protein
MSLEKISGFLLVLALLGALLYIFKELFSSVRLDFRQVSLSDALGRQRNTEPEPINQHLVGMTGEVVRRDDDSERPMKIRLGLELWPARLEGAAAQAADAQAADVQAADVPAADNGLPAVGARVVVTAVQGPVVVVRPADPAEAPA